MFSLAIQSGGESSRMGKDKGLLLFRGVPLIQWMRDRFRSAADDLFVTTNRKEDYRFTGLRLAGDFLPGRGALGGLYTALRAARFSLVGVVAVDMPFAAPEFFLAARRLLLEDDSLAAVVPSTSRGLEPFHAVYRRELCLPLVESALESGAWKAVSWMQTPPLRVLSPEETHAFGADESAFLNLNTPKDLLAAQKARFS